MVSIGARQFTTGGTIARTCRWQSSPARGKRRKPPRPPPAATAERTRSQFRLRSSGGSERYRTASNDDLFFAAGDPFGQSNKCPANAVVFDARIGTDDADGAGGFQKAESGVDAVFLLSPPAGAIRERRN